MSQPVVASIPRPLGRAEALRRLQGGGTGSAARFSMLSVDEETWNGDQMTFRVRALAPVASGSILVAADHVRLERFLPWRLQTFAETVKAAVSRQGRLLLGRK
ncbi:MAG: polyhydroxyalkanoic acid synthase [Pseudorhodoplanes sp.]|nr:MAG: polyhydroxyalkanoic acid synthase [Pseudorhodoplanes sp.]